MTGVESVVGALLPLGKAGNAPLLPEGGESVPPPGQDLMGIGLVTDVEDDSILLLRVDPVQGDDQVHRPQAGSQVSPIFGHAVRWQPGVPHFWTRNPPYSPAPPPPKRGAAPLAGPSSPWVRSIVAKEDTLSCFSGRNPIRQRHLGSVQLLQKRILFHAFLVEIRSVSVNR